MYKITITEVTDADTREEEAMVVYRQLLPTLNLSETVHAINEVAIDNRERGERDERDLRGKPAPFTLVLPE